jgi:hypothetical protein
MAAAPDSRVKSPTATMERLADPRSARRYPVSRSMPPTMS